MKRGITVLLGGEAGQGIESAGYLLGKFFNNKGLYSFAYKDYQSLIRGGHNFTIVRASEKEIICQENKIDVLIALNNDCLRHLDKLRPNSTIICDEALDVKVKGMKIVKLPFSKIRSDFGKIYLNSACISALLTLLNYNPYDFIKLLKKKQKENKKTADFVIKHIKENYSRLISKQKPKISRAKGELIYGSEAICRGMLDAGLERYFAYPMTPSTSMLHYLASKQKEKKILALQPENEIAVINMALGSLLGGKITAIGTSGGGFDLMTEALSFAGVAEMPLLLIEAQRAGPSTGVPTYTSQADLQTVLYSGHGEFPRIVLAPADPKEAYEKAAETLDLAWQFQSPAILLTDKHLSESAKTTKLDKKVKKLKLKFAKGNQRYKFTKTGVSPYIIPGTDAHVKVNSYEHNEEGYTTEKADMVKKMNDKRMLKRKSLVKHLKKLKTVNKYGKSDNVIVAWGSTVPIIKEALQYVKKPVRLIQPIYLEPFPVWDIEKDLKKAKKIIAIECNTTSQLSQLIRKETGIKTTDKILRYDARPFDPKELAEDINKVLR